MHIFKTIAKHLELPSWDVHVGWQGILPEFERSMLYFFIVVKFNDCISDIFWREFAKESVIICVFRINLNSCTINIILSVLYLVNRPYA